MPEISATGQLAGLQARSEYVLDNLIVCQLKEVLVEDNAALSSLIQKMLPVRTTKAKFSRSYLQQQQVTRRLFLRNCFLKKCLKAAVITAMSLTAASLCTACHKIQTIFTTLATGSTNKYDFVFSVLNKNSLLPFQPMLSMQAIYRSPSNPNGLHL